MKPKKKEIKQIIKLHGELQKAMDGYSVYICLTCMSSIIGGFIVNHLSEEDTELKLNSVFTMIKQQVEAREMMEKLLEVQKGMPN